MIHFKVWVMKENVIVHKWRTKQKQAFEAYPVSGDNLKNDEVQPYIVPWQISLKHTKTKTKTI